jgi:hypothetical protein
MPRSKSVGSRLPTGAPRSQPVTFKMLVGALGLSPTTIAVVIHVVNTLCKAADR